MLLCESISHTLVENALMSVYLLAILCIYMSGSQQYSIVTLLSDVRIVEPTLTANDLVFINEEVGLFN